MSDSGVIGCEARWLGRMAASSRMVARAHRPFAVVLSIAVLLRVACMVAYWPALLYSDSWAYLRLAYSGDPVAFAPDRPSGYPLVIRILTLPGRQLAILSTTQHLAGLVVGVLVYVLLLRLGSRRWLATVAAAIVLLDAYAISLEQYVMAETFFGLCVTASAYLAVVPPVNTRRLATSAALLAIACTLRGAGLFAIPIWVVYVLWRRAGVRAVLASAVAFAIPLLIYAGLQSSTHNGAVLTGSDGWFLYGRVAGFASCHDEDIPAAARPLCPRGHERGESPGHYVWYPSPANRMFPGGAQTPNPRANSLLRRFALAVIRDQPLTYVRTVSKDMLRLLANDGGIGPADALVLPTANSVAVRDPSHEGLRSRYFPRSPTPRVQFPASLLRGYHRVAHTQGWLMALLWLASFVAIVTGLRTRRRAFVPRRREVFLLAGGALAFVLGQVATVEIAFRSLIPAVPLLVAGGTLALEDLVLARNASRQARRRTLRSSTTVLGGDVAAP